MLSTRERDHLAPGERVADAAVERIRPILGEPDDVRLGLHAGQAAAQAGDAGAEHHDAEPQRHPPVEAALEQIERQRTWRDEEHEDPDRPVIEPVIELVALADLPLGGVLDRYSGHVVYVWFRSEWGVYRDRKRSASAARGRCQWRPPGSANQRSPRSECGHGDPRPIQRRVSDRDPLHRRAGPAAADADAKRTRRVSPTALVGVIATSRNPAARSSISASGHRRPAGERDAQSRCHRRSDRLAIKRVAARGTEEHRIRAERRGVAEDAADVVGVRRSFEDHDETAARYQPAPGDTPADGRRARGSRDGCCPR